MSQLNLSTLRDLLNDAFDLEGLTDFCFLHFRPIYDQFQETDRKKARVRMLIEYAARKGQLAELLALIRAENPGKYAQYANQLGPLPPAAGSPAQGQAGIYIAGDVHGDVVGGDKVGGDKVAGDKIQQSSVFNQSGQQVKGNQYNVTGNLTIHSKKKKGDDEEEK